MQTPIGTIISKRHFFRERLVMGGGVVKFLILPLCLYPWPKING